MKNFLKKLGPGFVSGAADDDPSGVATYSIAGAKFGYGMLWMTVFLVPAMVAVQEMCGRLGMLTGRGLAGIIRKYYSRWLLYTVVFLLTVANVINIGADLGIISASLQTLLPVNQYFWLVITAVGIVLMELLVPYQKYAKVLRWLAFSLLVYVVTALLIPHDWGSVLRSILIPRIEFSFDYMMTMVGFLGTTISPYLFFWQAGEEVEEEIAEGKIGDFNEKPEVSKSEIMRMRRDTRNGMVFSNLITFFIILTTAGTLHRSGVFLIDSPQVAAEAMRPLAGSLAYILFSLGVVGIGLQAIPVLAGSVAYAVSESMGLKEGLSKRWSRAKGFYLTIVLATLVGMMLNLMGIKTMEALFYSAVLNGVVAVPLIFVIIRMASDSRVVGDKKTPKANQVVAWMVFGLMLLSVGLLFLSGG